MSGCPKKQRTCQVAVALMYKWVAPYTRELENRICQAGGGILFELFRFALKER